MKNNNKIYIWVALGIVIIYFIYKVAISFRLIYWIELVYRDKIINKNIYMERNDEKKYKASYLFY